MKTVRAGTKGRTCFHSKPQAELKDSKPCRPSVGLSLLPIESNHLELDTKLCEGCKKRARASGMQNSVRESDFFCSGRLREVWPHISPLSPSSRISSLSLFPSIFCTISLLLFMLASSPAWNAPPSAHFSR